MNATLATDLFDQARIAFEAALSHLRAAGTPTNDIEASNLAAAYRAHILAAQRVTETRNLFATLMPTGVWEFDDGRVQRLVGGDPVWTSGRAQRVFRVGEFEGVRPLRWEQQDDWEARR